MLSSRIHVGGKEVKREDLLSVMRADEEGSAKVRVGLPVGCVNSAIAKLLEKPNSTDND